MPEKNRKVTKIQVEQYRTLLLNRREELVQSVRSNSQIGPRAGLQGATGDTADRASSDYMVELFGALLEKQAGTLEEVEHALAKIANGTYGQCDGCEGRISAKRLKAISWAKLCRDCQENEDRAKATRSNAVTKAAWADDQDKTPQ